MDDGKPAEEQAKYYLSFNRGRLIYHATGAPEAPAQQMGDEAPEPAVTASQPPETESPPQEEQPSQPPADKPGWHRVSGDTADYNQAQNWVIHFRNYASPPEAAGSTRIAGASGAWYIEQYW